MNFLARALAPASLGLGLLWIALLGAPRGYASLGGNLASVRKDALRLGAPAPRIISQSRSPGFKSYEISAKWLRLHELVGSDGKVFALTWTGRRHPDLRSLLGDHLKDFQSAIARARRAHRRGGAIIYDSGDIHLEIGGHMMAVYGIAWLKSRLPQGMDVNEIR